MVFFCKSSVDLHKQDRKFCYSCFLASPSSCPSWRARADASFSTSTTEILCHPPNDSQARGTKTIPCLWQSSCTLLIFLWKASSTAYPCVVAAPLTLAICSGLTTVTSNAVSRPPDQCGIRTTAGFLLSPGSRKRPSLEGARAAATAVLWMASRKLLCLAILSPWKAQQRAWSPRISLGFWQAGYGPALLNTGQPSLYFTMVVNYRDRRWRQRLGDQSLHSNTWLSNCLQPSSCLPRASVPRFTLSLMAAASTFELLPLVDRCEQRLVSRCLDSASAPAPAPASALLLLSCFLAYSYYLIKSISPVSQSPTVSVSMLQPTK